MSSRETRSRKKAATEEQPPPPPKLADSSVAVSGFAGTAAGPTPAGDATVDSPANPQEWLDSTVVPTRNLMHSTRSAPSIGGSTHCSNASAARLRRLQVEYAAAVELAEAERRREDAEVQRIRVLTAQKIELARAQELLDLEQDELSQDEITSVHRCADDTEGRKSPTALPCVPAKQIATLPRVEASAAAPARAPALAYDTTPARAACVARPVPSVGYAPTRAVSAAPRDLQNNDAQNDAISALAAELKKLADRPLQPQPLHPRHRDLPRFSGERAEWLAFLASYRETNAAYAYTAAENMTRLRTALTGSAREKVEAYLLSSGCDLERVLQDLQRIYGRPRDLIDATKKKVLQTKPLQDDRPDLLDEYACRIRNLSYLMRHYEQNTDDPHFIENVLSRLTPMQRVRYGDYAERYEHSGQSQLELISDYLCIEADKAMKFHHVTAPDAFSRPARPAQPPAVAVRGPSARPPPRFPQHANAADSAPRPADKKMCHLCEEPHALPDCKLFIEMKIDERWDAVREASLCFKCLRGKHRWGTCKAKSCKINGCKRPHHRLLHHDRCEKDEDEKAEPPRAVDPAAPVAMTSSCFAACPSRRAYLKIAPVVLRGARGTFETYALLDDGSTVSLLESAVADKVGAKGKVTPLRLYGIGGALADTGASRRVTIEVRGRYDDTWHTIEGARTVKQLGLSTQTIDTSVLEGCAHLRDIEQELQYIDAQPTLLVGQDNWHLLVSKGMRTGGKNQPIASRTDLGWVLHGFKPARSASCFAMHACETEPTDELERLVRENFAIESLGVAPRAPRVPAEERAMKILRDTTTQLRTGRYEVGLLWKTDDVTMPPNEQQALTRLRSVENKMSRDPNFAQQYVEKMRTLIETGYAEPCPPVPSGRTVWYLPHFAIKNPNKPGKIRIVHDAAACVGGTCLNSNLLPGPDMLQPLLGVLLRFREGAVAVIGDIKEMFMRVHIRPDDRDAQRFLWRENSKAPPQKYRMASLIFGATSSPCTALYIKNENARRHAPNEHIRDVITRDHYMDDAIHSCMSDEEAATTVRDVTAVHAAGGFEIRGWASNRSAALQYVAPTAAALGL